MSVSASIDVILSENNEKCRDAISIIQVLVNFG